MNASRRAIAMAACTGMVALHLTFPMMVALAETQVRKTDVAEVFCGVGSIWKAGAAFGYHCEGFDKDMDQGMNVFYANGLEELVKMVGRVKPGGLLWISPDCSSFCGLCVAQTERSLQNPSGNLSRNCVKNGNFMAMVSMMLFVLGWMLGACPVLENPAGNWIWKLPAVRQVFEHIEFGMLHCADAASQGDVAQRKPMVLQGQCQCHGLRSSIFRATTASPMKSLPRWRRIMANYKSMASQMHLRNLQATH